LAGLPFATPAIAPDVTSQVCPFHTKGAARAADAALEAASTIAAHSSARVALVRGFTRPA
jgi:hypothetical protein